MNKIIIEQESKEERKKRQDKAYSKMLKEISYKDPGEVFRNNMMWRSQSKVEVD